MQATVVVGALGDNAFAGNLFYYSVSGNVVTANGVTNNTDVTPRMTPTVVTYQYEGNL